MRTSQPTLAAYGQGARILTIKTLVRAANAGGFDLMVGLRVGVYPALAPAIPCPLIGIARLDIHDMVPSPSCTSLRASDLPQ